MLAQQRSALHSNQQSIVKTLKSSMVKNEEEFSFLADFVSEDIMLEFFGYQPQQVSKTVSNSDSYGGGVAEIVSGGGHSSSIGEQSNDEIRLIGKNTNPKSTKNWISKFAKWADDNQLETDLTEVPEDELDGILQRFYAEIRKNNGENYEPESLKVMHH